MVGTTGLTDFSLGVKKTRTTIALKIMEHIMDELLLWDQHKSMNIGSWEGISYSIIFEYPDIDSIFASNPWLRMLEMFDGFGPI